MLFLNTILQDRYRIIRQLGQGGMGTIYEALDQRLNAIVALKKTLVGDNEEARRAFEREAALLANLHHQSLPKVMDYFIEDGGEYLVMEYIPGYDLAELLMLRGAPFEVERVLGWANELLKVLEYLHGRSSPILHRDIKPSNLKLTREGELFLLDFGLAKGAAGQMPTLLTSRSVRGYTPVYASLEQIHGKRTDTRSDLYSLGATLYHLLTNVPPVDAPTRYDALEDEHPDPLRPPHEINPQVHPAISAVIEQAAAVSRKHRYASAKEMRLALRHAGEEAQKDAEQRLHLEAEQKRREQEEEQRRRSEGEAARRRAEEERQRREAEEEAQRRAAEEAARLRKEQEQRRIEEETRVRAEEERKRADEQARQREKAEAARLRHQQEEAEKRRFAAERERLPAQTLTPAATAASASPDTVSSTAQQPARTQPQATSGSEAAGGPFVSTLQVAQPDEKLPGAPMSKRSKAAVRGWSMDVGQNLLIILYVVVGLALTATVIMMIAWIQPTRTGEDQPSGGNPTASGPSIKTAENPKAPAAMVYVKAGTFTMGRNGDDEYERPAHQVTLKHFFIDIYEVTNEEYAKFVRAKKYRPPPTWPRGGYPPGNAHKPVTGVTWDDASAYAQWAGKRLPTEEEWEYAARGTDARLYPWGDDWRAGLANAGGILGELAIVGSYKGMSPFGAFDMAGNAWEWTADTLEPYKGGQLPAEEASGDMKKVVRGGNFKSTKEEATTTYRMGLLRENDRSGYKTTSFRCVKDVD
jgi:formylglycine-generating enzyme required for sulfatase activity